MRTLILLTAILLTGCATPPAWVADMYDRNDPCQARAELGRPAGYERPNWCGSAGNRVTIYNTKRQAIGYIKQ